MTQRAIGTWFYEEEADRFILYQQGDSGPRCVGEINSEASADFICERLNEPNGET